MILHGVMLAYLCLTKWCCLVVCKQTKDKPTFRECALTIDLVSILSQNAPNIVWRPGSAWTRWRSLQRSPDPLAVFKPAYFYGDGRGGEGTRENRVSKRSAGMISSRFPGDIFTKLQQNLHFYRHLKGRVTKTLTPGITLNLFTQLIAQLKDIYQGLIAPISINPGLLQDVLLVHCEVQEFWVRQKISRTLC